MRMSTKSRFAVTAMIDIALRGQAGPISLTDISARHQISVSYLEQLFSKLRVAGLVNSTRGPSGGYSLARCDQKISVADIVAAIEEPISKLASSDTNKALTPQESHSQGMTQTLWDTLNAKVTLHLQAISLRQLADEQRERGVCINTESTPVKRGVYVSRKLKPVQTIAPNSVFALGHSLLASR